MKTKLISKVLTSSYTESVIIHNLSVNEVVAANEVGQAINPDYGKKQFITYDEFC